MKRIAIEIIKSRSLGHDVFRGSIKARELFPALWIDRYDADENPEGYQRRFNERRSEDAAKYADEEKKGFWPECILNIRATEDADGTRTPSAQFSFTPREAGARFGLLTVDYEETRTKEIGGELVPWLRAFSEVDCQHRLGKMADSDKEVTICVFAGLTAVEEAMLFRTINTKQQKMDTSLVDTIIARIGRGPLYEPEVHWAKGLAEDVYSPFYRRVDFGGANLQGRRFFVKERTLRDCTELTIGKQVIKRTVTNLDIGEAERQKNYNTAASFLARFWAAVKQSWPECWDETDNNWKRYKLVTTPGLKGLAMVGNAIFDQCRLRNDYSQETILSFFKPAVGWVEWENDFRDATGNAGAPIVNRKLRQKIVPETAL